MHQAKLIPFDTELVSEARSLVRRFESCTLPRAEWTHDAHVRVGLWYLIDHGLVNAVRRMRRNVRRYNAFTGKTQRERAAYHETVTVFSLWMIERWRAASTYRDGPCAKNVLYRRLRGSPILETARIFRHYSGGLLFGAMAHSEFVSPDRSPMPNRVCRYLHSVSERTLTTRVAA